MIKKKSYMMIQMTDTDAAAMLRALAKAEMRSYGNQVAYLIRQEYARRDLENNTDIKCESEIVNKA